MALATEVSCTPGPYNMIATVIGANHGFRAALRHVFGVPFGFASMFIAGVVGVAALLLTYSLIVSLIKWAASGICSSSQANWRVLQRLVAEQGIAP